MGRRFRLHQMTLIATKISSRSLHSAIQIVLIQPNNPFIPSRQCRLAQRLSIRVSQYIIQNNPTTCPSPKLPSSTNQPHSHTPSHLVANHPPTPGTGVIIVVSPKSRYNVMKVYIIATKLACCKQR